MIRIDETGRLVRQRQRRQRLRQLKKQSSLTTTTTSKQQCRIIIILLLCSFFVIVLMYIQMIFHVMSYTTSSNNTNLLNDHESTNYLLRRPSSSSDSMTKTNKHKQQFIVNPNVSYNVHSFYYPWYCNLKVDGVYMHWNHPLLKHWDEKIAQKYPYGPSSQHNPLEDDIGSSYFPKLGTYSSIDPSIIHEHMKYFVQAGVGVAIVSWYPSTYHDENGPQLSTRLPLILDIALEYGIKVAIHIEPYPQRTTVEMFRNDVIELLAQHGNHPALYRLPKLESKSTTKRHQRQQQQRSNLRSHNQQQSPPSEESQQQQPLLLPVLYVYDQYTMNPNEWRKVLGGHNTNDGLSIRGTQYDVIVLALIVERNYWNDFVVGGGGGKGRSNHMDGDSNDISNSDHDNDNGIFDGGYTYFASNTFTYGSNPNHWAQLQMKATKQNKYFIPSVGPGYDDTRVRPWNYQNTKNRQNFTYYDEEWYSAIYTSNSKYISITSFNEWHEGTQIEPAISNKIDGLGYHYKDYEVEGGPDSYLIRTKYWVERYKKYQTEQISSSNQKQEFEQ